MLLATDTFTNQNLPTEKLLYVLVAPSFESLADQPAAKIVRIDLSLSDGAPPRVVDAWTPPIESLAHDLCVSADGDDVYVAVIGDSEEEGGQLAKFANH